MGTDWWKRLASLWLSLLLVGVGCSGSQAPGPASRPTVEAPQASGVKRVTVALPADVPFLYTKLSAGGLAGQATAVQSTVLS
jgi:hypothetical protein